MGREAIFSRTALGAALRHTAEAAGGGGAPYITCPSVQRRRKKKEEYFNEVLIMRPNRFYRAA